jgi:hypothetical protein
MPPRGLLPYWDYTHLLESRHRSNRFRQSESGGSGDTIGTLIKRFLIQVPDGSPKQLDHNAIGASRTQYFANPRQRSLNVFDIVSVPVFRTRSRDYLVSGAVTAVTEIAVFLRIAVAVDDSTEAKSGHSSEISYAFV